MIKNRAAALGFRVIMLGANAYILFQTIQTMENWGSLLWEFPLVLLFMTMVILLVLVIMGILQIRKHGTEGQTRLTWRIRGAYLVSSICLLVYYLVFYRPTLLFVNNNAIHLLTYIVLPVFWMLDSILFDERNKIRFLDPVIWVILTVGGYVGTILLRASSTKLENPYVYDALNVMKYGPAAVAKNVTVLAVIFLMVSILIYKIDSIGKKNEE